MSGYDDRYDNAPWMEPTKPADTFRKQYVKQSPERVMAMEAVKDGAATLELLLKRFVAPSRELSLAITKLEECAMWAVKGITAP